MSSSSNTRLRNPEFHGRIGVASREITPPLGIYSRVWGSSKHDNPEGVHRPLLARCLVFQHLQGAAPEQVLVTFDGMSLWPLAADKIRQAVEARLGLSADQVSFHPSHSHSTPYMAERHLGKPGGGLILPYLSTLPDLFCALVAEARAAARESILTWAYGRCALAFNRDAMDAATGRHVCGLNPLEKADDSVLVGRVTDMSGRVTATLVNYACHPVSLGGANRLLSPDYIGAMRELVERDTGGAPCVFLHGPSGDLTPRRSYEADVQAADQNGKELGYAALAALTSMFPPGHELRYAGIEESGTALGVWKLERKATVSTELSVRRITTSLRVIDMPTRREIQDELAVATERYQIERLERALLRRDEVGDDPEKELTFTLRRLGDSFIVATPWELYSQFQMDLRAQFPDSAVAVLNLTDGISTYLPTPASFGKDIYQVRIALYEPDSLGKVAAAARAAIAAMS